MNRSFLSSDVITNGCARKIFERRTPMTRRRPSDAALASRKDRAQFCVISRIVRVKKSKSNRTINRCKNVTSTV
jgi:hypothetical protein